MTNINQKKRNNMFKEAKRRDLYKTSRGEKAFYWFYSPVTKAHYLTIEGSHPAIQVDDEGKNCMKYNEDHIGFEEYLKIDIVGKWEE